MDEGVKYLLFVLGPPVHRTFSVSGVCRLDLVFRSGRHKGKELRGDDRNPSPVA